MKPEELGAIIAKFVLNPRSIPFAGAGVGCRVNLPTWRGWMGILAEICREYGENAAAELIEIRANDDDYLGAASIYKTCRRIPDGERLSRMAAPFRHAASQVPLDLLETLVALPVSGIVTTNYDRSLHDAYAKYQGSSALPLELSDSTLRNAALISEFFIARIHGRAELPQSMILDHSDYALLANNKDYKWQVET